MRADQPKTVGGHGYVFRFGIARTDLERIAESRPFREAQITGYLNGGSLCWDWKDIPLSGDIGEKTHAFSVYSGQGAGPSWYDLESWDSPHAHALVRSGKDGRTSDIQVLIYSAELGEAYFIIFHYGGGRPPFLWR
jgi:hypothetical protein